MLIEERRCEHVAAVIAEMRDALNQPDFLLARAMPVRSEVRYVFA